MVTVNVRSQRTTIKASYRELSAADLAAIAEPSPRAILQALSDAPLGTFAELSAEEIAALWPLVSWIEDPAEAAAYLRPGFDPDPVDVAAETFEKMELAKRLADIHKRPFKLLPELCRVYYGEDPQRPAAEAMALGALVLDQLNAFFERFKDLAGEPPSEEEKEAGIDALHSFGPYGIAESIGSRYGVKPMDVFKWSAEEVYLDLLYSQAKSRYQDNLREIERRKSAGPKK